MTTWYPQQAMASTHLPLCYSRLQKPEHVRVSGNSCVSTPPSLTHLASDQLTDTAVPSARRKSRCNIWPVASEAWSVRVKKKNPMALWQVHPYQIISQLHAPARSLACLPWQPSLCQWTEVEYWRHPQHVSDTEPRAISSYRHNQPAVQA